MPRAVITPEVYERLVKAFREEPGNKERAARLSGCGPRMAKRAWESGWPRVTWATPIRAVIERDREEARAAAARQADEERARQEELRLKAREEAVRTRTEEIRVVQAARGNALAVQAITRPLLLGLVKLAEFMRPLLEDPEKVKSMDPEKLARMIERLTRAARQAGEIGHRALVMERKVNGEPPPDVSDPSVGMSTEDALREITEAEKAAKRFLAGGEPPDFKVIEGGKAGPPAPPSPTGTNGKAP